MARKRARRAVPRVDPKALAEFQAGIRKRYTDEEILDQLRACAAALGRSPTMREFEAHPATTRPSADRDRALRHAGTRAKRAGRACAATIRDAGRAARLPSSSSERRSDACRRRRTSTSTAASYRPSRSTGTRSGRCRTRSAKPASTCRWGRSGSSARSTRASAFARRLGRLPRFADWSEARQEDASLLTEWQVYRMFEARRGAWATFQFLVRERLLEMGVEVAADGSIRE